MLYIHPNFHFILIFMFFFVILKFPYKIFKQAKFN